MTSAEIRFHGAAGTVTGSCFEVVWKDKHLLIDCGFFQGTRTLEKLSYEKLPFDPASIDAVILTHAHLDHSGRLPYLVASGCTAPIWTTPVTADILGPLLLDSAKLQAASAKRRNRRPDRAGSEPFVPLYNEQDVDIFLGQISVADYCQKIEIGDEVAFRFWDARHILGSASIELILGDQRLLFSGDLGSGAPIYCADSELAGYTHIICESTYGDRNRAPCLISDRREALATHIEDTMELGGNLLIPAFAIERTQVVLEDLIALFESDRLPRFNVFVDAPLAHKITCAMLKHRDGGAKLFAQPNIRFTSSVEESKQLNNITGAIIIAGSGMCEGGRIRHHLIKNLPKRASRVLLVGFQVSGTLGSVLRDGAEQVRISGHDIPVRATVARLDSYSSHADQQELLQWMTERSPISGSIFLVHGEKNSIAALAEKIAAAPALAKPITPALGEIWKLPSGSSGTLIQGCREDEAALTSANDWSSDLAAFRSVLAKRLREEASADARAKVIASLNRALDQARAE